MDNMIVKSKSFEEHVKDLEEIFFVLDCYQMKLNLTKSAFFIRSRKFLGYMASSRRIKPNQEKVQAIFDMPESACIRDVQRLMGRVIMLNLVCI